MYTELVKVCIIIANSRCPTCTTQFDGRVASSRRGAALIDYKRVHDVRLVEVALSLSVVHGHRRRRAGALEAARTSQRLQQADVDFRRHRAVVLVPGVDGRHDSGRHGNEHLQPQPRTPREQSTSPPHLFHSISGFGCAPSKTGSEFETRQTPEPMTGRDGKRRFYTADVRSRVDAATCRAAQCQQRYFLTAKGRIPRRRHRHRHRRPCENPRRHVRHARFPCENPREDVGVGVVECGLNNVRVSSKTIASKSDRFDRRRRKHWRDMTTPTNVSVAF